VLVQIGAYFWPALLLEMMRRWSLSNSEAGWITSRLTARPSPVRDSAFAAAQKASAQTPLSSSATSAALLIASARSLQLTARTKWAARAMRKLLPARHGLREWASASNSRRIRRR
jgi:hypothetical protein